MKLGEERTKTEICVEQTCEECGEPATNKHTFLLAGNCRNNPASNAYGKDDCSWCSDASKFSCDACKNKIKPPDGMSVCSIFPRNNFEHMFLYWEVKN
jgi:hypothetical protein